MQNQIELQLDLVKLSPADRQHVSLMDAAALGFHFCLSCQKICEDLGEQRRQCSLCGSHRVKWCPPVAS